MHFTLPALAALSTLTLLTCHKALAVPVTSTERFKSETFVLHPRAETPAGSDAFGMLDSRSPATGPLQARAEPWVSQPLYRLMRVYLNESVARQVDAVDHSTVEWKLKMWYTYNSDVSFGFFWDIDAPKKQDFNLCVKKWTENTSGINYVTANVDFVTSWWDEITGNVLTMFWSAALQLGQGKSFDTGITQSPSGYLLTTPSLPLLCSQPGGTSVNPDGYVFDEWTP